jgi:hypothetical protein
LEALEATPFVRDQGAHRVSATAISLWLQQLLFLYVSEVRKCPELRIVGGACTRTSVIRGPGPWAGRIPQQSTKIISALIHLLRVSVA